MGSCQWEKTPLTACQNQDMNSFQEWNAKAGQVTSLACFNKKYSL